MGNAKCVLKMVRQLLGQALVIAFVVPTPLMDHLLLSGYQGNHEWRVMFVPTCFFVLMCSPLFPMYGGKHVSLPTLIPQSEVASSAGALPRERLLPDLPGVAGLAGGPEDHQEMGLRVKGEGS